MIVVTLDTQRIANVSSDLDVETIHDYTPAYVRVLSAIVENEDLRLLVREAAVFTWLKTASLRFPQGTFTFETLDARQALAQRWGVDIPADVRNEEILESDLLALDLHAQPGQSFDDLLLSHTFAPLMAAPAFPFTQAPALFDALDRERWKAALANPLLARTLHQRLEAWKAKARSSEQRQLIAWFGDDPFALYHTLMAFRVLRAYPVLGDVLLGEAYAVLSALHLPLADLAVDESEIPDAVTQVTYHLNQAQATSVDELKTLLDSVSGLLRVELETIEKHLRAHPEWLSFPLIDALESRFEALGSACARRLAALRGQIRPPKPQAPDGTWDAETMLTWATTSYLPYQAWCSAHGQVDAELYAIGDAFSAWLMANWHDLHANSGRMVFNVLPAIASELTGPDRIHLLLVVDNLGWTFGELLRELFEAQGFYLLDTTPYMAMPPTETEISKKCLLSGAAGYTDLDETSYKAILEKGWVPYFGADTAFRYLSNVGKLQQVASLDARAYVVNYLPVDTALHQLTGAIGMPHRDHVYHLLEKLVEAVVAFVDRHALRDRIRIHVLSDHGSTQIPSSLPNDLDPAFFKQSGFSAHSPRCLEVSDVRFAGLGDNLRLDCFFLSAVDFRLPRNVLCARRANRFVSTTGDAFVHGGLLPEEVIVPYMAFEPTTAPLQPLTLLLLQNVFRYRVETVELEIGNPNDFAVEQVQLLALNNNVQSDIVTTPLINGKHKVALSVPARFGLTSLVEEQTRLRLRLRYRYRGQPHMTDFEMPIVMRRMVQEKSPGIFDE